jgi:hypothetical protein
MQLDAPKASLFGLFAFDGRRSQDDLCDALTGRTIILATGFSRTITAGNA